MIHSRIWDFFCLLIAAASRSPMTSFFENCSMPIFHGSSEMWSWSFRCITLSFAGALFSRDSSASSIVGKSSAFNSPSAIASIPAEPTLLSNTWFNVLNIPSALVHGPMDWSVDMWYDYSCEVWYFGWREWKKWRGESWHSYPIWWSQTSALLGS